MTASGILAVILANGSVPSTEAAALMQDAGYTARQFRTARERLDVYAIKRGFGPGSHWELALLGNRCPTCDRPLEDAKDVTEHAPEAAESGVFDDDEPEPASPEWARSEPSPVPAHPLGFPDASQCNRCAKTFLIPPGRPCLAPPCKGWLV